MKEMLFEWDERGFNGIDGTLCASHVIDPHLLELIETFPSNGEACRICNDTEGDQSSLDSLMDVVAGAVNAWYRDPDQTLPWDGGEGGYQGPIVDVHDVIDDVCCEAFEPSVDDNLQQLLTDACRRFEWTVWGGDSDTDDLEWAWEFYASDVKHTSRFILRQPANQSGYTAPHRTAAFLDSLLTYATPNSPASMLECIEPGLRVYRGRLVEDIHRFNPSASTLGPAPRHLAAANRMSAAGISLMYAAADVETALTEIAGHGVQPYAVIGCFVSTRRFTIIDFTKKGSRPRGSMFDPSARHGIRMQKFLQAFIHHVTVPVIPDDRQHVEYAPTQALTEYLRWMAPQHIDGIALPSAQTGRRTYVFFYGPEEVVDTGTDEGRTGIGFRFDPDQTQFLKVKREYSGLPASRL